MKSYIVIAVLCITMQSTVINAQSDINEKSMSGFIYTNLRNVYDKTPEGRLMMLQDLTGAFRGGKSSIFRDDLAHFRQESIINRIRENISSRVYGPGKKDIMSFEEAATWLERGYDRKVSAAYFDSIVHIQREDGSYLDLNYRVEAIRWPGQTRQPFINPLEGGWIRFINVNGREEPILKYSCGNDIVLTVADKKQLFAQRNQQMTLEGDEPDPQMKVVKAPEAKAPVNNISITFPPGAYQVQQQAVQQQPQIIVLMQPAAPQVVQTVAREPEPRRISYEEEQSYNNRRQYELQLMQEQQYYNAEMLRMAKRNNTAQWVGNIINAAGHTINAFQNGRIIGGLNSLASRNTVVYNDPYYNRDPGYYIDDRYSNPNHYSNFSIPWNNGGNTTWGNFQGGSVIPNNGTTGFNNGWGVDNGGFQPISWTTGTSGYTVPVGNPALVNPYFGPGYTTPINGGSVFFNDWRYRPVLGL